MTGFAVRPYHCPEQDWVAQAHQRVYAREYQWGPAFSAYAARVAVDFAQKPPNPREELWVAEQEGKLIGSIMLCETDEPETGQLRLFLVEKDYRCCGVGQALTTALLHKARTDGYRRLTLWTAGPLTAAIRHYKRLGFRQTETSANTEWSLSGDVVEEIKMELELNR